MAAATGQSKAFVISILSSYLFFSSLFSNIILAAAAVPKQQELDRISSLPGQPPVTFSQFSGYVTVNEKQGRALFYWLTEATSLPEKKPLVLWLNGGHYVPQLAKKIHDYNKAYSRPIINLKGFMVGNAVTDNYYDSIGTVTFWWSHSMISDKTYKAILKHCNFTAEKSSKKCDDAWRHRFSCACDSH
ncbi:Peptidase S10, serine carboxypeptidase [Corchorus olitorius]|uniref:Peptidase S10, serine carboxypeptidase n=1 Tax=Corchorus olitorius TaxID=93759 RepID=A0A1R3J7Q5_9ROSI|nr:Peptidase S10, serine carboxypeptidase [Corchorus olitorius]